MKFVLFYEKAPGFQARQTAERVAGHKCVLDAAVASGSLLFAGSFGDPDDGSAMLIFESESRRVAEDFARHDPYVLEGVVTRFSVRRWDATYGTMLS